MPPKCKICGNQIDNQIYDVNERMFATREKFHYMLCKKCGTLQLEDDISNIGKYYPKYYYSFLGNKEKVETFIQRMQRKIRTEIYYLLPEWITNLLYADKNEFTFLNCLKGIPHCREKKILDVGCGAGIYLDRLYEIGFNKLTGIDLYASKASNLNWRFYQKDLFSLEDEKYDIILLHHSFEHMDEPHKVMSRLFDFLTDKGILIIRIPVMGKKAWRMYGTNWYQIDAPRHLYLYTERSLAYICKKAKMHITKVKYDSTEAQFRVSQEYMKSPNQSLDKINRNRHKNLKQYESEALKANRDFDGDQAIFYIMKKN